MMNKIKTINSREKLYAYLGKEVEVNKYRISKIRMHKNAYKNVIRIIIYDDNFIIFYNIE